jgi:hypothetical protein
VKRVGHLNREEGKLMANEESTQLNREEGKLMTSEESRTADQRRRGKAVDKWREEIRWTEKKEIWWQVKRGRQLNKEVG